MSRSSRHLARIAGLVLVVLGAALALWAYQDSQSIGNELATAVSGSPSDEVVYRYIAAAAALVAGLYLALLRR